MAIEAEKQDAGCEFEHLHNRGRGILIRNALLGRKRETHLMRDKFAGNACRQQKQAKREADGHANRGLTQQRQQISEVKQIGRESRVGSRELEIRRC